MALAIGCGSHPSPEHGAGVAARPAKIITVGGGSPSARSYPGRVQAARRVPLSFRVGGPVVDIPVGKGEKVRAGEVLARIDPRDYEVQVGNLEAQLAAARAHEVQAADGYQRVRGLYEHDNASKADFESARAALDVRRAQVEATEQALTAARLSLADSVLRAPSAGTVADRLVEAHQTVSAGQPVVLFQGAGEMEVLIHVPEREIAGLANAEPEAITVRFNALPGAAAVPARVKEFATETDRQTQTFPVTLELEGRPSTELLPGMTASVRLSTGNGAAGAGPVVVPLSAVGIDPAGGAYVWRVDPDSMVVTRAGVTTGELSDSGIEIATGVEPGDRILAAGVNFVADGQRVRPLDTPED